MKFIVEMTTTTIDCIEIEAASLEDAQRQVEDGDIEPDEDSQVHSMIDTRVLTEEERAEKVYTNFDMEMTAEDYAARDQKFAAAIARLEALRIKAGHGPLPSRSTFIDVGRLLADAGEQQ